MPGQPLHQRVGVRQHHVATHPRHESQVQHPDLALHLLDGVLGLAVRLVVSARALLECDVNVVEACPDAPFERHDALLGVALQDDAPPAQVPHEVDDHLDREFVTALAGQCRRAQRTRPPVPGDNKCDHVVPVAGVGEVRIVQGDDRDFLLQLPLNSYMLLAHPSACNARRAPRAKNGVSCGFVFSHLLPGRDRRLHRNPGLCRLLALLNFFVSLWLCGGFRRRLLNGLRWSYRPGWPCPRPPDDDDVLPP